MLIGCQCCVQEISLGESEIVLTGGAENMSLSPHAVRGIRFGVKLGQDIAVCFGWWLVSQENHFFSTVCLCCISSLWIS